MTALQYGSEVATLTGKYAMVAARLAPASRVFDVGCYTGGLAASLTAAGHTVIGLEKDPEAARIAERLGVSVRCGDIEDPAWMASLDLEADAILLLDVLEHLRDPGLFLRQIRPLLHQGGRLLVTGPNVAYWGLRKSLLFGKWEYGDAGLMDRTHLRFFTRSTWITMLEDTGYRVVAVEPVDGIVPLQTRLERFPVMRPLSRALGRRFLNRWPELFTVTFFLEAVPG
jgi:2-polyprenyl-3-methyl-5-hydroxy-6-metoxy-1,4-benzoquinol methylase